MPALSRDDGEPPGKEIMSGVRYVCLSDLHLGAGYSILTGVDQWGNLHGKPSHTLETLAGALLEFVGRLSDDQPPKLVLLGDILDLTFSSTDDAATTFGHFVDAMFPPAQPDSIFSRDILFIPGNHDHHVWQTVKDWYFMTEQLRATDGPGEPIEVTPLFASQVSSKLINELIEAYLKRNDVTASVAYPNFGLKNKNRCVLLHHGHYVDAVYRAMTSLNRWLWPGHVSDDLEQYEKAGVSWIEDLERQNGSWIDFVWSGLGNAGLLQKSANTLYSLMQDGGESHRFSRKVAAKLLACLADGFPVSPGAELVKGVNLEHLARAVVDITLGRAAEMERYSFLSLLSDSAREGLVWYLSGPLLQQLRDEDLTLPGRDVTFIFGHTHKPFEDRLIVPRYDRLVKVFNTGGWVLDQPRMTPLQGAAAVIIDDELNVASLRLFNDPVNDVAVPVDVQGIGDSSLLREMRSALEQTKSAWSDFSAQAVIDIALRARVKRAAFFDPETSPGIESEEIPW